VNPVRLFSAVVDWVLRGAIESCSDDERRVRRTLVTAWVGVSTVTPTWGATYIIFDEVGPGLIPSLYGPLTWVSLYVFRRFGGFEWLRVSQLVCHLLLPFPLMWSLGGFGLSSAVLIWGLLAPLSSVWAGRGREAWLVTGGYLALTVLSAVIDSSLRDTNNLPEWLILGFYAGNFVVMTVVIVALLNYFTGRQQEVIGVLRRNSELEAENLQQELSLRQSDKLATLGKLSAGLAHELNNPAAAVQQATQGLSTMLMGDDRLAARIESLDLADGEAQTMAEYAGRIHDRAEHPHFLDPLERSDRESEVQDLLDRAGVDDGWEVAPALVGLGFEMRDIERLVATIDGEHLGPAVGLLADQYERQSLLNSLDESTRRIIAMVSALKTYAHLDQAPRQLIDIHEGLDSTLVMLQNRLKTGIEVVRDYDADLPMIEAYASELNQVWTNILDNAIDAMGGIGVISLTTRSTGEQIVVELGDDGPGVPGHIVASIFDPFVTTKAPGNGTGLGLNISHGIVTRKHGGEISVASRPGRTVFTVCLPIARTEGPDSQGASNG
jgi:signal transduction histidine kinase